MDMDEVYCRSDEVWVELREPFAEQTGRGVWKTPVGGGGSTGPRKTEAIRLSASDEYLLPSEASRMMRRFLEGENASGRYATNVMRGS